MHWVLWRKPSTGEIKLNTDGNRVASIARAGFGGVFRDDNGVWMGGFSGNPGAASVLLAELQGIKHVCLG